MKRKLLILIVLIGSVPGFSQRIITLGECYEKAYAVAPVAAESKAYTEIWRLRDMNLSKGWLPTLDANGSFVYNSSVIDLTEVMGALPIPGINDLIKPLPHEQYKVTLDINQVIYDGGAIKGARTLEKAEHKLNWKQVETDLYKLRGQVNSYYFNLMLLDKQKEVLQNYLELIGKRINAMNSALASGVVLKSDIDVLTAEKIRLEQQLNENGIRKAAFLKILSDLTGTAIDPNIELVIPSSGKPISGGLSRPELQLFDLRKEQLQASLQVIQGKRMPKAFGFATLGYGNPPGSNFFRDEFAPYYIIGAGVKWNIYDWNRVRNEKQVINLQQGIIDGRKKDLEDNLNRLLDAKNAEIASLESLLEKDSELIGIRKRITTAAGSQYENGTITATEYLNEVNSERQALLNAEIHKINLALARVEYLNISGKEIE
jgi:outer membrane protein TolC